MTPEDLDELHSAQLPPEAFKQTVKHYPVLTCEIRDQIGNVESACTRDTPAECFKWYMEHGISPAHITPYNMGYTYRREF